ncbi:hypothetical protein [Litoribacillus peritrichatus]|uniref:Phage gp6-like head-tail connector protein n=1 Tax=Litoribacillus peritrichatus TaxID=718191 RepID=A0ABP7M8C8_9GAMM
MNHELIDKFKADHSVILDRDLDDIDIAIARYDLARSYLAQYPELNGQDYTGRGLPAQIARDTKEFLMASGVYHD